jgi:hypothetical protein
VGDHAQHALEVVAEGLQFRLAHDVSVCRAVTRARPSGG